MSRRQPVVVLTSAGGGLAGLAELLRGDGLTVRESPLQSFEPPADWTALDSAIRHLDKYAAVAVTSPRAAEVFAGRVAEQRGTGLAGPAVWATGDATAAPLERVFAVVRLPSGLQTVDGGAASMLGSAMLAGRVGSPVLFAAGDARREELPSMLRAAGIQVDEVICYHSVLADETTARRAVAGADVVLVSSPRVAALLAKVSSRDERPALVAIGPTTAAAARHARWSPDAVARRPTVEAVAARIRDLVSRR
jgi:uroporphyrinogen-III synthase